MPSPQSSTTSGYFFELCLSVFGAFPSFSIIHTIFGQNSLDGLVRDSKTATQLSTRDSNSVFSGLYHSIDAVLCQNMRSSTFRQISARDTLFAFSYCPINRCPANILISEQLNNFFFFCKRPTKQ